MINQRGDASPYISQFIIDLYCHEARLAIEVDGNHHLKTDAVIYDTARTEFLNAYGIRVLRFSNFEVDNEFLNVQISIDRAVKKSLKHAEYSAGYLEDQPSFAKRGAAAAAGGYLRAATGAVARRLH